MDFLKSKPTASSSKKPYSRIPSTSTLPPSAHSGANRAHSGANRKMNNQLFLKKGMKSLDNPVTNSTAYDRAIHIQSCATGHQNGGSHAGKPSWQKARNSKLKVQAKLKENDILKGVICYFNGYTGPTMTDYDIKGLVQRNGGQFRMNQSSVCTHIIAFTRLSASKQHVYLNKSKQKQKVVHPDWIIDSVKKGKRQKESDYSVISSDTQPAVSFSGQSKPSKMHAANYESPADIPAFDITAPYRRNRTLKATASEEIILTSSDEEGEEENEVLAEVEVETEDEDEFAMPPCGQTPRAS